MNITGTKCSKHDVLLVAKYESNNSCKYYVVCPVCEKERADVFMEVIEKMQPRNPYPLSELSQKIKDADGGEK